MQRDLGFPSIKGFTRFDLHLNLDLNLDLNVDLNLDLNLDLYLDLYLYLGDKPEEHRRKDGERGSGRLLCGFIRPHNCSTFHGLTRTLLGGNSMTSLSAR